MNFDQFIKQVISLGIDELKSMGFTVKKNTPKKTTADINVNLEWYQPKGVNPKGIRKFYPLSYSESTNQSNGLSHILKNASNLFNAIVESDDPVMLRYTIIIHFAQIDGDDFVDGKGILKINNEKLQGNMFQCFRFTVNATEKYGKMLDTNILFLNKLDAKGNIS
jgi:hypothetical protein